MRRHRLFVSRLPRVVSLVGMSLTFCVGQSGVPFVVAGDDNQRRVVALRDTIRNLLDAEPDRSRLRAAVVAAGDSHLGALTSIARSDESDIRRIRAVEVLATFNCAESVATLDRLTDDRVPEVRCYALRSIAEFPSLTSVPILIAKLDDRDTCMDMVATDPARTFPVFVSDEAVRLLEGVVRRSFEPGDHQVGDHRMTDPWKEWWRDAGNPLHVGTTRSLPQCAF